MPNPRERRAALRGLRAERGCARERGSAHRTHRGSPDRACSAARAAPRESSSRDPIEWCATPGALARAAAGRFHRCEGSPLLADLTPSTQLMPRYGASQEGAAPKRCSQYGPPPQSPSKSHAVSHGTEAAPLLRASLAYALPVRACSRRLSRKRGERERHVHACPDCTSSAVVDPRTWCAAGNDAGTGAGPLASAGPRGRRPRAEQGRHRLDAYLDCARTVDVGTGAGALLRRTGAHEEHAVGAHAGLRRFLAGDGALVRLRLLACLHPG